MIEKYMAPSAKFCKKKNLKSRIGQEAYTKHEIVHT